MYRYLILIAVLVQSAEVFSQRLVTTREAIDLSLKNKINIAPPTLQLQQQQQLLKTVGVLNNPEVEFEKSPYEGLLVGIQQRLLFPTAYASQKALQRERIQLANLMIRSNENDIKRLIRINYLQLQYLAARSELLFSQDSLYQAIKTAAKRNFDAGQINKLQELFAANAADKIHNEVERNLTDLATQKIAFGYITTLIDDFTVEPLSPFPIDSLAFYAGDSLNNAIQQQILQQQVVIARQQLKVERTEILPEFTAGPLFPLSNNFQQAIGYRIGIAVPIWLGQNRARINAAKTGIDLAESQRLRDYRNFMSSFSVTYSNLFKEQRTIEYFNNVALNQASEIIETSLRLFQAGETSYIEALRNIITAFETKVNYLDAVRNFNQAVIELKYLNGTL